MKKRISIVILLLLGGAVLWWFTRPATGTPSSAKVAEAPAAMKSIMPVLRPKPAQVEAPKIAPAVPGSSSLGNSNQQQSAVLPAQGFRTSPAQETALKIELDDLISNASKPLVIGDPRLWVPDPTPTDPDALSVRRDALHYFLSDGTESDERDTYSVDMYYVPSENRFYFRRMSAHGPSSTYGPFDGDPVTVLGLPHQP